MSIARVQHLYETKQIPLDTMLDVLACAVERNPNDRNLWIRLVNMLRSKGKLECDDECNVHTNNTPESCAYHMDIHGDRWWWGKSRKLEWEDQFFYAPKTSRTRVKPEFVRMVLGIIELPWLSNSQCLKSESTTDPSSVDKAAIIDDPKQCMNWLFRLTKNNDIETDEDKSLKSTSAHDELLPTHISYVVCSRKDPIIIDSSLKEIEDRLSTNPSCEALCLKIAVACHLVGVSHPFVVNTIWWLAVKLWRSHQPNRQQQQTRDGVSDGLHWLSLHGLNIPEILHKKLTLCQEDCS